MKTKLPPRRFKVQILAGKALGVSVYRGYAPLSQLARISKADIYDVKTNPTGTQRDLSPRHAKEAYEYVRDRKLAYWPEVFLCVRDPQVVKFNPRQTDDAECGELVINTTAIKHSQRIAISRVDGNHRLHYADGHDSQFAALDRPVSFCLAIGLTLEDEITPFRDINNIQKRMNTSHLDNIQTRLATEEILMQKDPEPYIAQTLGRSTDSPLHGWVYEGGVRNFGNAIPLRRLKTGIEYMFSRPSKLTALKDAQAQYKGIRNYFNAVKQWIPDAWKNPKDYVALRGSGLWGICFLGADVIDRTLSRGAFESSEMLQILKSGKVWDWTNKGSFAGLGGRAGAVKIREMITNEFEDKSGVSVKE